MTTETILARGRSLAASLGEGQEPAPYDSETVRLLCDEVEATRALLATERRRADAAEAALLRSRRHVHEHEPSRATRLAMYRAAIAGGLATHNAAMTVAECAVNIERAAHAMLAAETEAP